MDLTDALAAREQADTSTGAERRYRDSGRLYVREMVTHLDPSQSDEDWNADMADSLARLVETWETYDTDQGRWLADEYRQVRDLLTGEGVGPMPVGDAAVTSGPKAKRGKGDDE